MIKRTLTFILAAICVLSQLTGCTPTDRPSSENPVTLTIWHVYGSQTKSPFNTAIDEFNNTVGKENGITVNVVSVTSSSAIDKALAASVNREPGAEELPDLFTAYPRVAQIVGTDRLLDWNQYFSEEELCNLGTLTATEYKVYELYLAGKSAKQIAEILGISENTLKYHNKNIYSKLGISSRKQMLRFAALKQHRDTHPKKP